MVEKINLLFGEKFISLAKMPRMLAEAMNPAPTHRTLNCLTKSEGEKKGSSLENDDYEKLLQIWEGLPPPPENATEQELQPYIKAANSSGAFTWKLGAVYKDSQYKSIRQIAVVELTAEIEKAIEAKQLTALWPHTRTAVDKWNDTALVSVEELSKYAAKKGIELDFERPEMLSPATPAPVVAGASGDRQTVEPIEQRRARYLEWHTEESRIQKRGAVQRVFERERLQNPRVDRSAIGKDIAKAREAMKTQPPPGTMFNQLVRDGRRQR